MVVMTACGDLSRYHEDDGLFCYLSRSASHQMACPLKNSAVTGFMHLLDARMFLNSSPCSECIPSDHPDTLVNYDNTLTLLSCAAIPKCSRSAREVLTKCSFCGFVFVFAS